MLHAFARSYRLTLSTLFYGAWAQLLTRYTGQNDVLFGITVSGRPPELAGVESMVGMFINTLPLRVTVLEDSHVLPWLRELQSTLVELRRHEAIPLSRVQSWSEVPAGMPLFESIVIVQNLPFVASLQERANQLGIESARYVERTHYPLAVTVVPGTELMIKISFDSERFDSRTIERTLEQLRTVLAAMTARPERRLVDLPILTESEREQLLGAWNRSEGELNPDGCDVEQLTEEELDTLIEQLR
jgi:non-ribosomal peptide synthetase component F